MKLKELLIDIFRLKTTEKSILPIIDKVDYIYLKNIKSHLLACDEFKNIKNLDFINIGEIKDKSNNIIHNRSYKLSDNVIFGNICYIHSISVTPEIYNPDTIHKSVKDGACITPALYNPKTFTPIKKICIEFSPEGIQDDLTKANKLIELFKKVLDSPEEYQIKGERSFIITGIFNEITINGKTFKQDISESHISGTGDIYNTERENLQSQLRDAQSRYVHSINIDEQNRANFDMDIISEKIKNLHLWTKT